MPWETRESAGIVVGSCVIAFGTGFALGTSIAGFPNLFMLLGPNTVSGQNSSLLTMEAQVEHAIDAIRFMDEADASEVEVRTEAQASFVSAVHQKMAGTVWTSGCTSWYLDANGRNTTLWPGLTRTFRQRTRRYDDENYLVRAHTRFTRRSR
jgi:hypothetical protein